MLDTLNSIDAVEDVTRICRYLALDDFGNREIRAEDVRQASGRERFDAITVFGNELPATLTHACEMFRSGFAHFLVFSGGRGHSTDSLFANISQSNRYQQYAKSGAIEANMPEAEIFGQLATMEFGIGRESILVEGDSRNTGENAQFSLELIARRIPDARSMLLLQDPLMQRRAVLTVAKALGPAYVPLRCFSRATFVPEIELSTSGTWEYTKEMPEQLWSRPRFLSLLLGEIKRLRNDENGYGPRGRNFLQAIEIPADVLASYERILSLVRKDDLERLA